MVLFSKYTGGNRYVEVITRILLILQKCKVGLFHKIREDGEMHTRTVPKKIINLNKRGEVEVKTRTKYRGTKDFGPKFGTLYRFLIEKTLR